MPAYSPMVSGTRSATLPNIVASKPVLLLLALSSLATAVEVRVAAFNIGAVFSGSSPDFSLGDPGTPDHETVRQILDRIDADVVALEEIAEDDTTGSPSDIEVLAANLGYPYLYIAPNEGLSGVYTAPFDTSLRVAVLSRYPFASAGVITSPLGAREMARFHVVVKVDVPGTPNDPVLIGSHLKSGDATDDRFRRVIEMRRLTQYLAAQGITEDDNFFVVGDFNLVGANRSFDVIPTGVPATYDLGDDVTFPVTYSTNPLVYFSSPGVSRLDPRQLDGSPVTFPGSGNVLDLMMVSPALAGRMHATEIYNSALDVSNASGLPKAGDPLASDTSATASDHLALFGDFELDADLPNLALSLSLPAVLEGMPDGTVMATVTLPAALAEPVNLTFSSDDPEAALPIPPVLQIPAGSITGSVGIRTPKNYFVDPSRSVTISVMAPGHDPDNAVLQVENVDGPYLLAGPGATVTESFDGFAGGHDPAPWSTTGALPWLGIDDGSSATPGLRAYGSAGDASLGVLPGGSATLAAATFVNDSDEPLTALEIAFDVEQWRGALAGTADTLSAELFYEGSSIALPGLAYSAATAVPTGPVAGGESTSLSATATGLAIPPGATFELRVAFTPGAGGGVAPSDVFVNEFHYDNTATDTGEFIEVAVAPGFSGQLSDIDIVLYNGESAAAGVVYDTFNLASDFTPAGTFDGYSLHVIQLPSNGIQNGDRDGFAVVHTAAAQVLHFMSYEGVFTASAGPAAGMTSVDIGVDQDPAPTAGVSSIGLTGSGGQASAFTWTQFTGQPYSAGQPNSGQAFSVPALPSQGIAIDNLSVTFLPASDPDTDGDGLPDSIDPDDDNDTHSDADEIAFGTDPLDPASVFRPLLSSSGSQLSFPGAAGIEYTVESSPDLAVWTELGTFIGNGETVVVPLPGGEDRIFVRVKAGE
jgi:endonuclease/exonuclease/phosphatase family metal-dependent hydrolase